MKRKNLIGSVITLIGLAALCAVLANVPGAVHAQTPANQSATGRPVVLASAEGAGILFADTEGIADANGLPISGGTSFTTFTWTYQWIRVDGGTQTNVGAGSASYQPVEADVGNLIKVKVSFRDGNNYSENRTSLPFGPIAELTRTSAPPSTLVSNTGQSASADADITKRYAQGFRLGDHGQGYEISSVSIELAAVPSNLTVSLWSGGVQGAHQPNTATKLFDFANPSSFAAGLNKFTAPAGAFAYQNVNYFIVLSGFGTTLKIKETTSDDEDTGGETGAVIYDKAAVRALSDTGTWNISGSRASVLRLAVEGSKRARGIVASNYAQPKIDDKGTDDTADDIGLQQETISLGDEIGFGFELGEADRAADRFLIRGVSFNMDDSTSRGSGFTNPFVLRSGSSFTGAVQFSLTNTRKAPGLPVWTAPQGATVAGGCTTEMSVTTCKEYVFDMPLGEDTGDENKRRRDAVLSRVSGAPSDGVDDPAAAGVSFTGAKGDVAIDDPHMAVLGEPLKAMVQNLGQANNGYASADTTNDVMSQGFTTGPGLFGYRLQGIGVNIEGSGSNYPDGPTSVSVAIHANSSGQPGTKLVDLVSPTEYAAGHSFFEAPPGTHLKGNTSYVLVWRHLGGTVHRLRKTSSDGEDVPALTNFSIANVFYRGADLDNLSANSGSNALEIAAYGEINRETVVYITPPPREPEEHEIPFIPGVTGGGPGHFGGDAILRCSAPPAASCPTYDDVPTETTPWSATLTVGERLSGTTVLGAGFNRGNRETDIGAISDDSFNLTGAPHVVTQIQILFPTFNNELFLVLDTAIGEEADQLTLHLDSVSLPLRHATASAEGLVFSWTNHGLTWSDNESIEVRISRARTPNAYGYRTIWTALMTAEQHPTVLTRFGYSNESYGKLTNNIIVNGRTDRGVVDDQFRYPWSGFEIIRLNNPSIFTDLVFDSDSYPSADEVAGWTLVLDGKELPFAGATNDSATPHLWSFSYAPGWTAGDQVLVSIRTTDEVQNRYGQVALKPRRSTSTDRDGNIVYGKTHSTYPIGDSKFGFADSWDLQNLRVTTDKTGDTDPVRITATFRAPNESVAWTGYWVGQFDDFHTLFLRWVYHEGGIGKGEATYTLPLRAAATEGGIQRSRSGRDISFTWVRTYKEFQRRHLDLANHSTILADFLAPPKPATRRAGGQGFSLSGYYDPAPTVTSVGFTSNPGSDRVYGPGDTIQVTVTFDQDVTVGYVNSKQDAAKLDLEIGGETRTAHYARTDGNRVIFEYTVRPGDETPSFLFLRPNSLRLYRDTPSEDGSIRNSSGGNAVLDHYGLADNGHLVDTVGPEFANAQVSSDGAQVAVTFNEGIRSPAILRAFGVQTSLLQSLVLDVRVDGEIAVRSDAAVSGDTVTLTVSEPITQGQTVTVSYDNLFIETGESIFEDLRGNSLLPFAEQPATNGSTVAGVDRPGGGLALSRTDILIKESQSGAYTVALTSQPAADVTVAIGDHPAGRATVSPTSLTFTADSWNTPQTVTITSAEDSDYVDRWVLLQHVATGDNYGASAAAWLILRDNYNLTTATPNTPATGSPTISGTPQVGQTLRLDISAIADADGLTNASHTYLYQWVRNGAEIRDATDTSYTLVDADEGKTIKVKVSFLDDSNNQETRTSAATVAVAPRPNSSPTGAPTINGTPQVRRTLTVDTSEIADADGMETAVFRYQWFAASDFATVEFHGETSPTYTVPPTAVGLAIKVKVSYTDDRGHTETLTSAATEVVAAAAPNSDPTGLPTIGGTPQVGETLTADTSAIEDADGLTNVAYSYQWVGSQSVIDADTGVAYILTLEIPDQTGSTYTLAPADEGWTFEVRVDFTDDAGNDESLTSAATEPVAARPNTEATGAPTISGTPQVDETLTADVSGIGDEDGLTNVSYRYQWLAGGSDIEDATSSSHLLTTGEQGQTVQVRVSFTDDADNQESLTSAETLEVAAKPNTAADGEPTISGTPQVEQTLTADTSAISDEDGLGNVSYQYQWLRDDADIAGQTNSTYTLVTADEGKTIRVRVTFRDDAGNAESLTSTATTAVAAQPAETPVDLLTASFANVPADHNGENFTFQLTFSENVNAGYARIRDDAFTVSGGSIASTSRITQGSNQGWNVEVDPTGNEAITITLPETTDCGAQGAICTGDGKKLSGRVELTVNGPEQQSQEQQNNPATGALAISGTPRVGETLTAETSGIRDADGLTNVSYRYQWIAGGSDIDGATGSSYTLTSSEQGQTVQVRVSFTDDADNQESLTSAETLEVAAKPNTAATGDPTISGTPQVEQTLTADTSAIADEDGLNNVSYQYQWLADDADIAGQTNSTYRLVSADEGKTIRVRVTFRDDAGNAESLTSTATTAVAAQPTPVDLLTASFANVPADHNGENFTFQLTFSENVDAGYARIQDDAFTVSGGSISSASRITQGSNQGWNVEVNPTGNEAITITLPETTDCNAARAICTDDERNALPYHLSEGSGSSRHFGQRCQCAGSRGSNPGLQRNAEPRLQPDSHRRLRHIRRHRNGRLRLHRSQRRPHLQPRRHLPDRPGHRPDRLGGRETGNPDPNPVQPQPGHAGRRHGHRHN